MTVRALCREGLSTGLVFKTMDIKEVVRGRDPLELLDSFETKGTVRMSYSFLILVHPRVGERSICTPTHA